MGSIPSLNDYLWTKLYADAADPESFPYKRPLLAHYTSLEVFEQILKSDEIWFSNPLFMNDIDEMRFGVLEGSRIFRTSKVIEDACETQARFRLLVDSYDICFDKFSQEHALDIYAFCLSEHEIEQGGDGLLSMWRGYGGNGKGVAIVFDTAKLDYEENSPFVVSRVRYESTKNRQEYLISKMNEVAMILKERHISDGDLYSVAHFLFERIKLAALFSKHHGFKEEKEWRIVYLKERDPEGKYGPTFGHIITSRGVEPKLRCQIKPILGIASGDFSLDKLIHKIILGPSIGSPLARESMLRLLDNLKKTELKDRIISSSIPFRPAV